MRRIFNCSKYSISAAASVAFSCQLISNNSSHVSENPKNTVDEALIRRSHPKLFQNFLSSVATSCDSNENSSSRSLSTNDSTSYLRRNFVAEAADIISPAVVNIVCDVNNFLVHGASSGSGFIYSKEGLIVTNAHVVSHSSDGRVIVTMWNGRKRKGVIHSMDKLSDLAVIKLTDVEYNEDLPVATLGTSGKLHIGEFVIALGSPLQLQNSISFGIVSATARHGSELGISQNRTEYIQTDAAINAGNSGGPLVNLDGEVVGINSMKAKDSDGVSFAIPIDTAAQIIKQLVANKRVVRPYVGLRMTNFSPKSKTRLKSTMINNDVMVLVVDVERNSPADAAGIKRYDYLRRTYDMCF